MELDPKPTLTELMQICDVSERTARRWLKEGAPAPMARLVSLTLRGRIMPESWPESWSFERGRLYCDTREALRWQHVTWFDYIRAGWYRSLAIIPELEATIDRLSEQLPRAQVVEIEAYRAELRKLRDTPIGPFEAAMDKGHYKKA